MTRKNMNKKLYRFLLLLIILMAAVIFMPSVSFSASIKQLTRENADKFFANFGILKMPPKIPLEGTLQDINGREVSLSSYRGKLTFLTFWTTWCSVCAVEMPELQKLYLLYKNRGFQILAVDLREPASLVVKYFKKRNLTYTPLLDPRGRFGNKFGIRSVPTTLILDRQGRQIGSVFGSREWTGEAGQAIINYLLNQE